MLLTQSEFRQQANFTGVLSLARWGIGRDTEHYRADFIKLVQKAAGLVDQGPAVSEVN